MTEQNNNTAPGEETEVAKFNMAIATLQDARLILRDIKRASASMEYPLELRQEMKVGLVKQFFVQTAPLLKPEVVKKYHTRVMQLTSTQMVPVDPNTGKQSPPKKRYDSNLEMELDVILIEIQQELQKEKMFMPPSDDGGMF